MNNNYYKQFANAAINIIIHNIIKVDIIVPKLVFDYSINPNIDNGYYMYQNITGDIITLNMNSILELKEDNDIKTVITYGFIHEVMHMFQNISSRYKTDKQFYTLIEDTADKEAIQFVRDNLEIINKRLNFQFNEVFINGIERQIYSKLETQIAFNNKDYIIKSIAGALVNKLNINFDYICNALRFEETINFLKVIINDIEYCIDINYSTAEELNILINLIYLSDFKIIRTVYNIEGYDCIGITFKLY